jgi:HEAT repeat protein
MYCRTPILLLALTGLAVCPPASRADEALDKALEALKTYDWGQDRGVLQPIDKAVADSHGDAAARKDLETRLAALLSTDAPRAAKDSVCRHLSLIGTAQSVSPLAALLTSPELSHMARYALERIPDAESAQALRDALPQTQGRLKVGVINSLAARRDAPSAPALVDLLSDSDREIVAAATSALGAIGNEQAAKALGKMQTTAPPELRLTVANACLACAEHLLADGKKLQAMTIYKTLSKADQPRHVRVAATRGLLSTTKQD